MLAAQEVVDTGMRVVDLVCDGPPVHLSMIKKLGANLDPDNLDTQVLHNIDGPPIHMILDMCHDIKNVRNAWKHHRILKNAKGENIDWIYLENLVHLQQRENLHCANKLTIRHINFENQKMKVSLATQLFSRSVAKSLKFCKEVLELKDFEGSEATEEFILNMNDIFDFMNSKSKYGYARKAAMRDDNKDDWQPFLQQTSAYLLGLKNCMGATMVGDDRRKTGLLGILANIHAVQEIFKLVVTNAQWARID